MLGIGIIAAGKDFRSFLAYRIVAGSPAAKAGLKAGDVIAEIDGQTTATLSMDQLRQIFKQDKPQYVITIKRGRQILPIRIKSEKIL
jgi:C-terminal processing protease CtpA/Prc